MIKLIKILSEMRPDLADVKINPFMKSFIQHDLYQRYVNKFKGQKLSSKETNLIKAFKIKPTKVTLYDAKWIWSNEERTQNFITILKKLKQKNQFSYTVFESSQDIAEEDDEATELKEVDAPEKDEIDPRQKDAGIEKPSEPSPKEEPPKTEPEEPDKKETDDKKEPEAKSAPELDKIKISISQPFPSIEGDLNMLKLFLNKLNLGRAVVSNK
jgi:hypothetical protein